MFPTTAQLSNILIHVTFLDNLPKGNNEFDMENFVRVKYPNTFGPASPSEFKGFENCGFSACALGWAAKNPDLPPPLGRETWGRFAERVFGLEDFDPHHKVFGRGNKNPYRYCFHSGWEGDEHAAAERLREVHAYFTSERVLD